ncbi:MAG TPA: M48 family metalloprotease [Polyangiaceae bacterium]|nr:M48 family metalloprotease [Polyangiaceae bacterium]
MTPAAPVDMKTFFTPRNSWPALIALAVLGSPGCKHHEPQVAYPTYQYGAGAPGQPAYSAPGAAPAPGAPAAPGVPAVPSLSVPPAAAGGVDPINATDIGFLRAESSSIIRELVAALPPLQQGRVANVPIVVDSSPGEVNAFATCTRDGKAAMAITDGLLDIQAHLARAKAYDELARTNKVGEYIQLIATRQQPKRPIVQPAPGFFDPSIDNQPQKLGRQREVLDEQIAFVLGHELAHHYLGHLPCTGAGNIPLAEVGQLLASNVPLFNQPNEIAADMSGLNDALTTGARRNGYHFTEGGALLTMQFFSGLDQSSPVDILFSFERDHPPPAIRIPIIQQTANAWRATGSRGLPYPMF